jgi:hypothetical protein
MKRGTTNMNRSTRHFTVVALGLVVASSAVSGCIYRSQKETVVPSASPPSTVVVTPAQRVMTYPEGRYELRGDGTASNPYFWVWTPTGTTIGTIPPPPPLPR